jgi:hypothetical protein
MCSHVVKHSELGVLESKEKNGAMQPYQKGCCHGKPRGHPHVPSMGDSHECREHCQEEDEAEEHIEPGNVNIPRVEVVPSKV